MKPHFIYFLVLIWTSTALPSSDMVNTSCERSPNLPYCGGVDNAARDGQRRILLERLKHIQLGNRVKQVEELRARDQPLSKEDRKMLEEIAGAVERYKRDPFSDITAESNAEEARKLASGSASTGVTTISDVTPSHESHGDSDLREKEGTEDIIIKEEGFIREHNGSERQLKEKIFHHDAEEATNDNPNTTRGAAEEYCDHYEQHFSFYCVGETNRAEQHVEAVAKFCPSYEKVCPHKRLTTSVAMTAWPPNPFTTKTSFRTRAPPSDEDEEEEEELTSEEEELERKETYLTELKRRFPCKPDCDRRIFPHCTEECKCDYIYPSVQRFCNPPPMPLFLNTCRLWYNGCSKYAQYHYASQYIYSKAEKGKKLPGSVTNNPNPYNIPAPAGTPQVFTQPRLSRQSESEQLYSDNPQSLRPLARSSSTFVEPPPLPNVRDESHSKTSRRSHKRRTRKTRHRKRSRKATGSFETNSQHTAGQRELYRTLRAINSLTAEPVKITRDPSTLLSGSDNAAEDASSASRARARQANTFPVVPSEAAYGADDTFKKFDGLTDRAGVLHRPRSRSPFTKPGLWEPNPDDPHNRDHANKFFFAPRSVTADWLNGQVTWGAHWAVPAAGVGGTDGYSALHFPTVGTFLNIPDDYD